MMNSALRQASGRFGTVEHLQGNKYINLIYAAASCMRKLSRNSAIPAGRKVWRGLGGVKLPKEFSVLKEDRGLGGVDFGFVSTTTDVKVAISYVGDKKLPILFEIEVGDIDRAVPLFPISQYPAEVELLIPPMSNIEVTSKPYRMKTQKGDVMVYRARVNCNQKALTIDEIEELRCKHVKNMLPYLRSEYERDVECVGAILQGLCKKKAEEEQKLVDGMKAEKEAFVAFCSEFNSREKAVWLNTDTNYKQAIIDAVDFRRNAISSLVRLACGRDEGTLHVAAELGHVELVKALLDTKTFPADKVDEVSKM